MPTLFRISFLTTLRIRCDALVVVGYLAVQYGALSQCGNRCPNLNWGVFLSDNTTPIIGIQIGYMASFSPNMPSNRGITEMMILCVGAK
jgi:hypothetical protein